MISARSLAVLIALGLANVCQAQWGTGYNGYPAAAPTSNAWNLWGAFTPRRSANLPPPVIIGTFPAPGPQQGMYAPNAPQLTQPGFTYAPTAPANRVQSGYGYAPQPYTAGYQAAPQYPYAPHNAAPMYAPQVGQQVSGYAPQYNGFAPQYTAPQVAAPQMMQPQMVQSQMVQPQMVQPQAPVAGYYPPAAVSPVFGSPAAMWRRQFQYP